MPDEPKQYSVTPRTIGNRVPRKPQGKKSPNPELRQVPEPPRPVPSRPIKPPIQTRPIPERTRSNRGTVLNQPHTIKGESQPYEGGSKRTTGMPKREEHALRQEARQKFPNDEERQDAYVYGTMRKQGWKPDHHSPWDGKTYKHWYWGKATI